MELYIKIKDNRPFEHPILGDNFKQAYPDIDVNNLPETFARFYKTDMPNIGVYELYQSTTYEWDDTQRVIKEVHHVRALTEEEKTEKQNLVKNSWSETGYPSWQFDEETCGFLPPTPYPTDGRRYMWNEENQNWELIEYGSIS